MAKEIFIASFLIVVIGLVSFAGAEETKENYPFNPSEIIMDKSWEEVLLVEEGFYPRWCGPRKIFYATPKKGFHLIDVGTREVSRLQLHDAYRYQFKGCLPSGRYIIFKRRYRNRDANGFDSIAIYDSKSHEHTNILPLSPEKFPHISFPFRSLVSPDGRYMAWYEAGEIRLKEGEKIVLVPVLRRPYKRLYNLAWAPDSKKIFLILGGKSQKLIVYDIETGRQKSFLLDTGKYGAKFLAVSPDGKNLYVRAILYEFVEDFLFRLNLEEIGENISEVKAQFLKNGVDFFSFGSNGKMVLNIVPSPDARSRFPFEFAGLYLADMDGNVLKRLTANNYDLGPRFSQDGRMILFERVNIKPGPGKWIDYIYILVRKK